MRKLPAQVCVIAAKSGDTRIAMTATAVTSLCADPPTLLVCLFRTARPTAIVEEAKAFSVNLLPANLVGVANQCALPSLEPEQRFDVGDWSLSPTLGQPVLGGATVSFECEMGSTLEQGTHLIVTGLIRSVAFADSDPLLYHDASYREIGPRVDALHLEWDSAVRGF